MGAGDYYGPSSGERELILTRRQLFGLQAAESASPLSLPAQATVFADTQSGRDPRTGGLAGVPHFAPKAKRVIFLHQSGAPSQMDLFDYKPKLQRYHATELPDSVRMGQRITGMTSGQSSFPVVNSLFKFSQHGQSGAWLSELLPHTAKIVDEITIVKSMNTEAINHDPAITFIQTGSQQPGRPSLGSWVSYGLGSENENLILRRLLSAPTPSPRQPLFRGCVNGSSIELSGVRFRERRPGFIDDRRAHQTPRRQMLDRRVELNRMKSKPTVIRR